jgi:hypothetical protein
MIPRTEESPNGTNDEANRYFEEADGPRLRRLREC